MQSRRSICSKRSDPRWWCSISSCRRVTATSWSSAWPARVRCRAPFSSTARETTPGPASPPPCAPPRGTGSCRATVCSPTCSGTARCRPRRVRRRCTRCRSGVEQPGVRPRTGLKGAAIPSDKGREARGGSGLPAGGGAGRWLAGRSGGRSVERAPRPQGRSNPAGPRPVADPALPRLAEQLGAIAAGAAAPEDMLEPALAAVLEARRASAGALCLFDQRHELLRLAAEVGLSDDGCKRLRQIRRGGMAGWDMPLHSLLNRRVYLIESAAKNRYVPPLVEAAASVTTIACVPLYAGTTPVASIVLVAVAPERITEQQIGPLSEPLRELARMIEAARRSPPPGARPARAPAARPAAAPLALARPAAERDKSEAARVQTLVTSLAEAERERARLAAALEAAAAERAERARAETTVDETRGAERAAEIERLMARLAEAEAAAARERERVKASEREREQLAAALREASERVQRAEEGLHAAGERAPAAHEDDLQRALAAARAAEEARAAADAEAEGARAALARAEGAVEALEDEKQRARDEIAKLQEGASTLLAERRRLEQGLEEARLRDVEARTQVAELERRIAALREQRQADAAERTAQLEQLRTRLAEAEAVAASGSTQVGEWERERDLLAAELREAAAGEQRAQEELRAATERAAAATEADLQRALATARAAEEARAAANADAEAARSALEDERQRARDEIARLQAGAGTLLAERERLEQGLAEARAREEEARGSLADVERRVEDVRAEREAEAAALSARLEGIAAERDRLSVALAAVRAERDYFAAEEAAADAAHTRLEEALAREAARRAAGEAPVAATAVPRQPARGPVHVVVVDDDPGWAAAAGEGRQVTVVAAGDAALESLGGAPPTCIVVNLAARGALAALATLREAGASARVWGCLATPATGLALPLGLVEPVARPVDPDALLATLRRHAARGARVLAAGADADALISLRQALVREGMSVAMAWDGARAVELLDTHRPEIVVIDLALAGRAGYALVARLAACDPPPIVALVPGDDDAPAAFAAALAEQGCADRVLPLADLLVRVLGQ